MKHKDELGGELSQLYELFIASVATEDKDGATQVYNLILYHLARKHNESLILSLDEMLKDL